MGRVGRLLIMVGVAAMAVPLVWLLWPLVALAVGSIGTGSCDVSQSCSTWTVQ